MIKPIAIIAGEPNSISSEIIFKAWKLKKKFNHKPFIIIGSFHLIKLQMKKLKYKLKIKEINNNFNIKDLTGNFLPVYNVRYNQNKAFDKKLCNSKNYIFNCFKIVTKLIKNKKILGVINCPVSKENLFKKKHQGITEFLAAKSGVKGKEVMLIYNKKLSVSPLTTHIPLRQVSSKIKKIKIVNKIKTINNFYKKYLKMKPKIAVLGLNPHNFPVSKKLDEQKIISSAITVIKRLKIKAYGPVSPDTSFMIYKKNKFNVIFGMYHDQVLTPFKALYKYDAVNITLGLPYIRISPDHGIAKNIMGKNIANPQSLIEAIKFFNLLK